MCVVHLLCYYLLSVPLLSLSVVQDFWQKSGNGNSSLSELEVCWQHDFIKNLIFPNQKFPNLPLLLHDLCVCVCAYVFVCALEFPQSNIPPTRPLFLHGMCECVCVCKCVCVDKHVQMFLN